MSHDEASQAGDALLSVERAKSIRHRRLSVRWPFVSALLVTLMAAVLYYMGAGA